MRSNRDRGNPERIAASRRVLRVAGACASSPERCSGERRVRASLVLGVADVPGRSTPTGARARPGRHGLDCVPSFLARAPLFPNRTPPEPMHTSLNYNVATGYTYTKQASITQSTQERAGIHWTESDVRGLADCRGEVLIRAPEGGQRAISTPNTSFSRPTSYHTVSRASLSTVDEHHALRATRLSDDSASPPMLARHREGVPITASGPAAGEV